MLTWIPGTGICLGTVIAQTIVETYDRRMRKNIVLLEYTLDKTLALQGTYFPGFF